MGLHFELLFTAAAARQLDALDKDKSKSSALKAVKKTLGLMEMNLRHPGLNTHKFESLEGPNGEEIFEAYAQQHTPAAYRIFWRYGPVKGQITIVAITPHP
ncbi:MAG: hypothetical protein HY547_01310 [Elusimicrobia bacterium]|nr:hypothetical protein [Elusimicrobiota bacterium]